MESGAQPVMTDRRKVDWIGLSRVEVLMIVVVGMMESNSRSHGMMMLRPEITSSYGAAELRHDHLSESLLREGW